MLSSLMLAGLLLQSGGATPPAAGPATEWIVVVAVPVYQPDGAVTTETATLPSAGAGLVHVFGRRSICDPAVAGAAEPSDAGFGWRVASQVVSRSDKDIVVSVDWRRLWDQGRKIQSGPGGTVQLTLHPGDRIPLDHIPNATPRGDCRAVGLGLEIRLGRTMTPSQVPSATLPLGATPGGAKAVDAELWLMHTQPSGAAKVVHQIVRIPAAGGKFGFAPTTVTTSRGDISLELTGSINRYRTPAGDEFMLLSMTRTLTGADLPAQGVTGTTASVVPMEAGEVLSFEMPGSGRRGGGGVVFGGVGGVGAGARSSGNPPPDPSRSGGAAAGAIGVQSGARSGGRGASPLGQVTSLLEGHQFALRVRITPVPVS
jgi:hypothetical protein